MAQYRSALPQPGEGLFLTDGGIETTLIFHDGLERSRSAPGGPHPGIRHLAGQPRLGRAARPHVPGAGGSQSRRRPPARGHSPRVPTGGTLQAAIERVDAATAAYPACYMINCAHPTHFERVTDGEPPRAQQLRGLRANASRQSHAELNESPTLDTGDPAELGREYAALKRRLPRLCVMGGCCGTDHRHVEQIAAACAPLFP